jgi:hypothetical protein
MPRDNADPSSAAASQSRQPTPAPRWAGPHRDGSDAAGAGRHAPVRPITYEELPPPVDPRAAAQRSPNPPEPYVDATAVAQHIAIERRQVLALTRAKKLPAYPVDPDAKRKTWRYRLSEVDRAIGKSGNKTAAAGPKNGLGDDQNSSDNAHGSSRSQRRKNSNG